MLVTGPQYLLCCDAAPGVADSEVAATADAHAVANVAVGVANLTENYVFTSANINTGAVSLDSPTLTVNVVFASADITFGAPSVPTLSVFEAETFSAPDLLLGNPVVGNMIVSQNHQITAQSINIGNPVIGTLTFPFLQISVPPIVITEQVVPPEIYTEVPALPVTVFTDQSGTISGDGSPSQWPIPGDVPTSENWTQNE